MNFLPPFVLDIIFSNLTSSNDIFSLLCVSKNMNKRKKYIKSLLLKKALNHPKSFPQFENLEILRIPAYFDLKLVTKLKNLRELSFIPLNLEELDIVKKKKF